MTRPDKKEAERTVLDAFLASQDIGRYESTSPEPPDFLVKTSGGDAFGVELVQYHMGNGAPGGSSRREFEESWEQLADLIRDLVDEHPQSGELHQIYARLTMKQNVLPGKRELPRLAGEMFAVVLDNLPAVTQCQEGAYLEISSFAENSTASAWVESLKLKAIHHHQSRWDCPDCYCGLAGMSAQGLSALLARKSDKVSLYRTNIPRSSPLWLLIYPGFGLSRSVGGKTMVNQAVSQCRKEIADAGFDEIWFYSQKDGPVKMFPLDPDIRDWEYRLQREVWRDA